MAETFDARLAAVGLRLPAVRPAAGAYLPARRAGNLLFLSGRGGADDAGQVATGLVGADVSIQQAYLHAQSAGLQLLSAAHAELGDLGRIQAVAKLFGMVRAVADFKDHSQVINGCSDLFVQVLGDVGRHARSAVGVASLPHGMSVEIEAVLVIKQSSD